MLESFRNDEYRSIVSRIACISDKLIISPLNEGQFHNILASLLINPNWITLIYSVDYVKSIYI